MAVSTYTVKRGDTLWGICTTYASSISGNSINAKIDTLVRINNIKDRNIIHVGQVLKFSGSASSSTTSSSSKTANVYGFGLRSDDTTGRAMIVNWTWSKTDTAGYTCRWKQYLNGKWVGSDTDISHPEDMYCQSAFTADKAATKVSFQVRPYYKVKDKITYWSDVQWSSVKEYSFENNPPLPPGKPKVTINDLTLTASVEGIKADELDATHVKFNIVKDNTSSIYTSDKVKINTDTEYVACEYTKLSYGSSYKVRCCSVNAKNITSGWSDFSDNAETRPSAPKGIITCKCDKRLDGTIYVFLEWNAVTNAEYYIIEYTTTKSNFEYALGDIKKTQTEDARTSIEITDIELGHEYFFRVRAARNTEGHSDPTNIVSIPVGDSPSAPTTWSSSNSVFTGETLEFNWTHNSTDNSTQTRAKLGLKINDSIWNTYEFINMTTSTSGDIQKVDTFEYGRVISYKGELHIELDTSHVDFRDAKVQWKVQTAGVTGKFGNADTDWSTVRTVYIYDKPTLGLSVTSDLAGTTIVKTLNSLPFYIRAKVLLESKELQRPIGYHLRIVSNDFYETVDDAGRTKTINPGDAVYSKYFSTEEDLIVIMSASNVDLESGIKYTVYCNADMSTGLSINQTYDFTVSWSDVSYVVGAHITISENTFSAVINPYCEDFSGNLVDGITMSVYRRDYDGSLTEIATGVPNNGTSVIDPHPALDYARYRLVAKDNDTGAISFYDMPGHRVGCTSVVIQWDEERVPFEISDTYSAEDLYQSDSILILPYNVKISDNRKRDVSRVAYAGREYPVSYHGTLIEDGSSWSTVIPKNDIESIYALRRLSRWSGPVYIREPSGMGFWANVSPAFNIDYDAVTIPVTLDVVRVEGGV